MPRKRHTRKPIERYEHRDKERVNNPPVGLVTPETDPAAREKKTYAHDPHLDPALQFDSQRGEVEEIIDAGLSAETLEQAKTALQALKKRQQPYLSWAGKAETTTFDVPTVSLHVHERIDPPYGTKYGSNFQPFVNKRDVRDGKDEDLNAEPDLAGFQNLQGLNTNASQLRLRLTEELRV